MSSRTSPRGLLLDAMGTLIGLRTSVGSTYAALASRHGVEVGAAAIDQAFPSIYRQAPPLAFPGLSNQALEEAEIDWWTARVGEVLSAAGALAAGMSPPPNLGRELYHRFAQADLWQVYADVPVHLEAWHRRGLQLAVVSNFDSRLPALLEGLGLARWLKAVVVSSSAGAAKPDPLPYQLALAQLGLTATQVWHVGDSLEDGAGAHAAGIRWVKVQRP